MYVYTFTCFKLKIQIEVWSCDYVLHVLEAFSADDISVNQVLFHFRMWLKEDDYAVFSQKIEFYNSTARMLFSVNW